MLPIHGLRVAAASRPVGAIDRALSIRSRRPRKASARSVMPAWQDRPFIRLAQLAREATDSFQIFQIPTGTGGGGGTGGDDLTPLGLREPAQAVEVLPKAVRSSPGLVLLKPLQNRQKRY
jgi:hypothetical protein